MMTIATAHSILSVLQISAIQITVLPHVLPHRHMELIPIPASVVLQLNVIREYAL
jgi:hypothetical protein